MSILDEIALLLRLAVDLHASERIFKGGYGLGLDMDGVTVKALYGTAILGGEFHHRSGKGALLRDGSMIVRVDHQPRCHSGK